MPDRDIDLALSVPMTGSLAQLPRDIITHHLIPQFTSPAILLQSHSAAPTAQATPSAAPLRSLASTSRHFRALVAAEYRTYCQHQYPSLYARSLEQALAVGASVDSIDWCDKVTTAEKLSSRWANRQINFSIVAAGDRLGLSAEHSPRSSSRSAGSRATPYAPCIDVHEGIDGVETLVIGKGTQLAVRVGKADAHWRWDTRPGMAPSADDFVGVHIFDEDTVLASRSRGIELVSGIKDAKTPLQPVSSDMFSSGVTNPTGGITSSCLDMASTAGTRHFAVTATESANEHVLHVFSIHRDAVDDNRIQLSPEPLSSPIPSKSWTSTFLTATTIATGHRAGVSLHQLSQSSISAVTTLPQPRTFYKHDLSVHSLMPLHPPTFSPALLATGWSDGAVRLVDTRVGDYVATYFNLIFEQTVPVYSLLHTGPLANMLLAGSSQHDALCMYDLRSAGGPISPPTSATTSTSTATLPRDADLDSCVIFLERFTRRTAGNQGRYNAPSSAIYSLAAPLDSSKVYAAAEGAVLELDFTHHPDGVARTAVDVPLWSREVTVPLYLFSLAKGRMSDRRCIFTPWQCGKGQKVPR